MQLCKLRQPDGNSCVGIYQPDQVRILDYKGTLSTLLHAPDPVALAQSLPTLAALPTGQVKLLAPLDEQEVWAAGVTYKRSKVAREEESRDTGGSRFYDLVYTAPRPEIFFKSPAKRVVAPGDPVRIRRDARWSVPEPEVALVISPGLKVVGYTIGNDMSSRDIEGENPLYLPQAKFYDGCCTLGPVITLAAHLPPLAEVVIKLNITRDGTTAFEGSTSLAQMARTFDDLVSWLGRETTFPDGVILLTGTGVVPPDNFTLAIGDEITIDVAGIGRLKSKVG